MENAVSAQGLGVTFPGKPSPVEALRGVDLDIPKGSLFVLLGPNGAGKTTLMRCITGLVHPARGALSVLGSPPPGAAAKGADPARGSLARIGVLIENPGAYGRLDVREYLSFFSSFYGAGGVGSAAEARIRDLCTQFGLELGGKPVSKLSQGNRQKLQLIRSLLHSPDLLLWDEPTDHLDPESQREVLGYLRSYLDRTGATALVATHRLEQMEKPASHFGFIRQGRIVKAGTREEILSARAPGAVRFRFASPPPGGVTFLEEGGIQAAPAEDGAVVSGPGVAEKTPALVAALVARGAQVTAVEPQRAGLPEIYAALMEGR
jgi:ABC-2 type transport system ATP-binding protein